MNALIIDDEFHARQSIRSILESQFSEIRIVGEADSVSSALEALKHEQVQLLFLDIDLPDGQGFDILKEFEYRKFKVIFITAYQEFALQAIKFSAFDYILKPLNPGELIETVRRVLAEDSFPEGYEEKFQAFFSNFSNSSPAQKKIVLKTADKIHVVDIKNIIRCEADNAYCTIHVNTGQQIVISRNLKSFESMLSPVGFIRVHQSHLINCNYISYFDKQDGGTLVMSDQSRVPVSGPKRTLLTSYLDSLG